MKTLFVGLGSVGRRHMGLLQQLDVFEFIWARSGKGQCSAEVIAEHGIVPFDDLIDAIEAGPDFAVVANPTAHHLDTAIALAQAGIPFLLEKPVSDRLEGMETLQQIVAETRLPVAVGFQMRHHPGYKRLLTLIQAGEIGKPLNLQGYVGQYLPDWRPSSDYRNSYSAKAELGGGVVLDLCHEFDIAISLMGEVSQVSCMCDRYSDLEIDTEDIANILLEHRGESLSAIHLNYLERHYRWITRVTGTLGTAVWDYGQGFVELARADGSCQKWMDPVGFERDWLFRDQLIHWLDCLKGKTRPAVSLEEGIMVTRVALAAKRSAEESRHIRL